MTHARIMVQIFLFFYNIEHYYHQKIKSGDDDPDFFLP